MAVSKPVFNPADMKFSAQFQNNQPTQDGGGGWTDNFVTFVTTRCALIKVSGSDGFPSGKMEYIKSYTLICRAQKAFGQAPNGSIDGHLISTDCRILINGQQYDIDDYELIDFIPHFFIMHLSKTQ
jgi:Phage head-tail joining protein